MMNTYESFSLSQYRDSNYPCFGALTGMTASAWWLEVVRRTYSTTEGLNQIEPDELEELLPVVFQMLYTEVFSTKAGWILKEDVEYTLRKLKEWRDQGGGPKIAVVSNFDDRLPTILADLGISKYFDFILTSFDQKSSKPARGMFDEAVRRAGLDKSTACYHVGDSVDNDVNGAVDAGWTALRIHTDFDEDFPDWFDTDTDSSAPEGAERRTRLMDWGRRNTQTGREWTEIWGLDDVLYLFGFPEDPEKPIPTTYVRGYRDD